MGYVKAYILLFYFIFLAAYFSIKVLFRWGDTALNREFNLAFGRFANALVGIKLEIIHAERADLCRPAILIGNHQSAMDFAAIGALCPTDTVVIGKREIIYTPFIGWFLLGAGNILINRSKTRKAREALFGAIKKIKENHLNLAMMPEGTRNRGDTNTMLPFKKGAFNLAIEAQIPIVAVVCSRLNGIALWEKFELNGGKVILSVLEPFQTKGLTLADVNKLTQEVWQKMDAELKRINLLAQKDNLQSAQKENL